MTANVRQNGMGTMDRERIERLASFLVPQAKPGQITGLIENQYLPSAEDRAV
jgi:hypothetical protein